MTFKVKDGISIAGSLFVDGNRNISAANITAAIVTATSALNVTSTQQSTSTTTGAVIVTGGVGVGGNLYATALYDNGVRVLTTASLGASGVSSLIAGTDTRVSSSVGAVVVWNESTLQSITSRGATSNVALTLTNTTAASATNTGALQVVGGVGIGGNLYVGGEIVAQKLTIQLTTVTTTQLTTDDIISTYNTTNSTSTNTGALQVAGGAGIGKDLYVGGAIYRNGISIGYAYDGSAGYNGSAGFTGSRGYTGSAGYNGSVGYTGSAGYNGSVGYTGSAGYNGSVGYTGSKGIDGFSGSAGFWGSVGYTGSKGIDGFSGSAGFWGSVGYTGSVGYWGSVGYAGSMGYYGSKGFTGSAGYNGSVGYTGSAGYNGSVGYTGSAGYNGSVGYTGSAGYNGSVGFTGSAGYNGSVGFTGSMGYYGSVGYTGSMGYYGSVGYTGSQGVAGPQGPQGYTGSLGYAGSAGPSNIINAITTASGTFYPVMVGATGNNQVAYADTGVYFDAAANALYVLGDFYVNGQQTILNSTSIQTGDKTISVSTASATAIAAVNAGLQVGSYGSPYITWLFDGVNAWKSAGNIIPNGTYGVGTSGTPWNTIYGTSVYDNSNRVVTSVTHTAGTGIGITAQSTGGPAATVTIANTGVTSLTGSAYINVSASTGSVTINNTGVLSLTGGTDITVSASTGSVTINDASTLQTVTNRGTATSNAILISNIAPATSTATGALQVVGGVGIGGDVWVGGTLNATVGLATSATNIAVTNVTTGATPRYLTHVSTTTGYASLGGSAITGLVYIPSTGHLGIGTQSPADTAVFGGKAVDVYGPVYARQSNNSAYYTAIGTTSGLSILSAAGTSAQQLFYTSGTEKMRINSSGNLGIGTTTPGAPLGFADALATKIQFNGNNANGYTVGLASAVNSGDAMMKFTAGLTGAGEFGFYNTTNLRLFINNAGLVGVGTSSPRNNLEVGNSSANQTVRIGGVYSGPTTGYTGVGQETLRHQLVFSSWRDAQTDTIGSKIVSISYTNYNGSAPPASWAYVQKTDLAFFTQIDTPTSTDNTTERLRITANGGIAFNGAANYGTSGYLLKSNGDAPPTWLDPATLVSSALTVATVRQTANASYFLTFVDADNATATQEAIYTTSSFVVNPSTGNVGLGIAAPLTKLHVVGTESRFGGVASGFISVYDNSGRVGYIQANGGTDLRIAAEGASSPMTFYVNGSERARISTAGNLGIGQSNPLAPLSFANAVGAKIRFYDTTNDKYGIEVQSSELRVYSGAQGDATGGITLGKFDGTTFTEAVRIRNDGNVAIGTTATTYKLQVSGSFAATTKSFVIDHPTKPGYDLRYGSLEGPENGVYVRGRLQGNTIELPDYWAKLVDPDSITVDLTPVGKYQKLYVADISNNTITVVNDGFFKKAVDCFYTVWAERADVEKLGVEIQKP